MTEDSEWGVSTGLADDFTIDIAEAWFARSAEIKGGNQLVLFLKGECDGEQVPEDNTIHVLCEVGWDSLDGGKTAVHESGKKKFHANSHMGLFVMRLVELGVAKDLEAAGFVPTQAAAYVGRKFHMKQKEFSGSIAGEDRTWYKILPEAYLGESGKGAGKAAAKAEKPAESSSASTSNGAGNKVLLAKLKAEAKKHDTHEAFVDAAMDIAGVADDDELLQMVVDEGAIYASARA